VKKLLAIFLVAGLMACSDQGTAPDPSAPELSKVEELSGNGFPQGSHDYKLNIIGVPKDKTAEMDNNNGRRIFVQLYGGQKVCVTDEDWAAYYGIIHPEDEVPDNPYACTPEEWEDALQGGRGNQTGGWDGLDKKNKILLTPNQEDIFRVLDANATDQNGAEFTMPDDVNMAYRVYARALGKPGGKAAMTLCGNETQETWDEEDGELETWCSINQAILERTNGKPKAEDVTDALFTMTILFDLADAEELVGKDENLAICLADTGLLDMESDALQVLDVPVFHSCFEDYFWNFDNNGLKLLELRFYGVPQ
jgi:hypothetical protein